MSASRTVATKGAPRKREGTEIGDGALLTVDQVAEILKVKKGTVYQWAYQRRISKVKLFGPRGPLRFRRADIDELIGRSLRKPVAEGR